MLQSATGGIEKSDPVPVACDGGRSAVRTQSVQNCGESNPFPWLVIDTQEAERNEKRFVSFVIPLTGSVDAARNASLGMDDFAG